MQENLENSSENHHWGAVVLQRENPYEYHRISHIFE